MRMTPSKRNLRKAITAIFNVILFPGIAVTQERFFRGIVDAALVIRRQLSAGDIKSIEKEIVFFILALYANATVRKIQLQFPQTPMLRQGNIPYGCDIYRFTTLATFGAFTCPVHFAKFSIADEFKLFLFPGR